MTLPRSEDLSELIWVEYSQPARRSTSKSETCHSCHQQVALCLWWYLVILMYSGLNDYHICEVWSRPEHVPQSYSHFLLYGETSKFNLPQRACPSESARPFDNFWSQGSRVYPTQVRCQSKQICGRSSIKYMWKTLKMTKKVKILPVGFGQWVSVTFFLRVGMIYLCTNFRADQRNVPFCIIFRWRYWANLLH